MTEARRVVLGRVARPHGLQGEVVVRETTIDAEGLQELGSMELVGPSRRWVREMRVGAVRPFGDALLVCFENVATLDQANELRGASLEIPRSRLPEPEPDEMYVFDLVGARVVEENGRELGTVREVLASGAHEILEIVPAAGTAGEADAPGSANAMFVPFHAEFVVEWDPEARLLRLRVPPGLEEIYRSG